MTNALQMTIGAHRDGVAEVKAAFAAFAERHALPAAVRRSVHVVLDELLTNTIEHGFGGRPGRGGGGVVTVDVELQADRVSVTVTDDGPPFDPLDVPAPDAELAVAERPLGGLGIPLVRRMMDEVRYERRGGRNVVVLTKLLSGGRSVDITTRTQQDATVVAFAGNLDSATAPQAQQAIDSVLAGGAKKLVIDFTKVDYVSSAGLRVLLGTAKRLGSGGLRLFGLNETVGEVFQISGFATILAVFPTESAALERL